MIKFSNIPEIVNELLVRGGVALAETKVLFSSDEWPGAK